MGLLSVCEHMYIRGDERNCGQKPPLTYTYIFGESEDHNYCKILYSRLVTLYRIFTESD